MNKGRYMRIFANILIVESLAGFLLTLSPIIGAYYLPREYKSIAQLQRQKGIYIAIPKIHAESVVIPHVDPWDEKIYKKALKTGVAQAKGTALPGEKGTIFLFAHSSGNPWEITHTNTLFLRLGELREGDKIYITRNDALYAYTVFSKKEVWPNEVKYLSNKKDKVLILQTCTPIGTSLKRLLIFAKQV